MNWAKPDHNYVPSYQMSAFPFVTSSVTGEVGTTTPVKIKFPYVTRWIVVKNTGGNSLKFGFTSNGVKGPLTGVPYNTTGSNSNYFVLDTTANTTERLEVKCIELWFLAAASTTDFSVMAGYTTVDQSNFLVLTGSQEFQGVG